MTIIKKESVDFFKSREGHLQILFVVNKECDVEVFTLSGSR